MKLCQHENYDGDDGDDILIMWVTHSKTTYKLNRHHRYHYRKAKLTTISNDIIDVIFDRLL